MNTTLTHKTKSQPELLAIFEARWFQHVHQHYKAHDHLGQVIKYVLENPGKFVRASLCLLVTDALRGDVERAMCPSFSLEMIHAYSLIHDDLPCMDNDDYRRGKLTAHKKFTETLALLAGDALQADAFNMLAHGKDFGLSSEQSLQLIQELSASCGSMGMVWGQTNDIVWTGESIGATLSDLVEIHATKTAALIGSACAMGAIAANMDDSTICMMRSIGRKIGLAFQIIDDLLDASPHLGKTPNKDANTKKLTFTALLGIEKSQKLADDLTQAAIHDLKNTSNIDSQELELYILNLLKRKK